MERNFDREGNNPLDNQMRALWENHHLSNVEVLKAERERERERREKEKREKKGHAVLL